MYPIDLEEALRNTLLSKFKIKNMYNSVSEFSQTLVQYTFGHLGGTHPNNGLFSTVSAPRLSKITRYHEGN